MLAVLERPQRPGGRHLVSVVIVMAVLLGWCVMDALASGSPVLPIDLSSFARNMAAGLFLIVGVFRLASWRLTSDRTAAWSAALFLVVGTALPAGALLEPILDNGQTALIETPSARALLVIPLVLFTLRVACGNRRRLVYVAAVIMAGSAVVWAAVSVLVTDASVVRYAGLWMLVESVTAGAWFALALRMWQRRLVAADRRLVEWTGGAFVLMAASESCKAWSIADPDIVHGISSGIQFCAAAITVVTSALTLTRQLRDQTRHSAGLGQALIEVRARMTRLEEIERERLHDARSVVLGMKGASTLMTAREHCAIDAPTLKALIDSELERLHDLLDPARSTSTVPFDVAETLVAIVLMHKLHGTRIETDIHCVTARGCPKATTTVVDNLLRNAERHAPGSAVLITARRVGGTVRIIVEDDGPGIPDGDHAAVMLPGVRGTTALGRGEGLGLHSAACAMSEQGGKLEIANGRAGGVRAILTLPLGVPAEDQLALVS